MSHLTLESVVELDPTHVWCTVDDAVVVMNSDAGEFYGLNRIATEIWTLLKKRQTVSELCGALTAKYQVAPQRCEQEVLHLLNRFAEKKIISVAKAAA